MNLRIKDHHKTRPSPSPEQEQLRKEIAFQTACYLAKGGEIKQLGYDGTALDDGACHRYTVGKKRRNKDFTSSPNNCGVHSKWHAPE